MTPANLTVAKVTDWIETERTRMRPFEEADAEEAFAWFSDPEVMKFIPGGADATLEDTCRRIARYREHQTRFGFSKRLIIDRETGKAIGDSGLFHLPDGERIELGFRLARPYWGAGYAIEVGRAWLDWFDVHLAGTALFADVHPDHVKSQRVLLKLGFQPSHSESIDGMTMLIYRHGETVRAIKVRGLIVHRIDVGILAAAGGGLAHPEKHIYLIAQKAGTAHGKEH